MDFTKHSCAIQSSICDWGFSKKNLIENHFGTRIGIHVRWSHAHVVSKLNVDAIYSPTTFDIQNMKG